MQEGNAALARRDYAAAEAAAREVLASKSPAHADAQFLLAQALSGKKDFAGAAVAYDDAYNRARTGLTRAEALLGLANALNALGEKRAACATLDKMRAEFPNPRPDLREPIASARQRAGAPLTPVGTDEFAALMRPARAIRSGAHAGGRGFRRARTAWPWRCWPAIGRAGWAVR